MAKGANWTIHETGKMGIPRFDLTGKVSIVTGAGSGAGIGFAIARTFAAYGAKLVLADLDEDTLLDRQREIIEESGGDVVVVACNVTEAADRQNLVDAALSTFGQVDVFVNAAGIGDKKNRLAVDVDEETWDRIVDVDMKAVFFLSQLVAKHMMERERGNIINIASFTARVAGTRMMPYISAKAGVVQMTRGMAMEWGRFNIRANCLCPGYIQSSMTKEALADPAAYDIITKPFPYNRKVGDPMDVAAAALFLACDASDMVTGTSLFVDGGRSAH